MKEKCGVVIDKSVSIAFCLSEYPTSMSRTFMGYLEKRPYLGILTPDAKRTTLIVSERNQDEHPEALQRADQMEVYIKTERIPFSKTRQKIDRVKAVFNKLLESSGQAIDAPNVSHQYQNIARYIRLSHAPPGEARAILKKKLFSDPVGEEDIRIIADTAVLKEEKYENMFLASFDPHIKEDMVSGALQKEFGIITGSPDKILFELQRI